MRKSRYYQPAENGLCVILRKGETTEELIKRFKKKFSKSGLVKELRDRMYYEKPSDKKRRKRQQSIRNMQREEEKRQKLEEHLEKIKQQGRKEKSNDRRNKRQSGGYNAKTRENSQRSYSA